MKYFKKLEDEISKKTIYLIAGLTGIALLAAGTFLATHQMNNSQSAPEGGGLQENSGGSGANSSTQSTQASGGVRVTFGGNGPDGSPIKFTLELIPAPEVPVHKADATGVVGSIKDETFIMMSGANMTISMDKNREMHLQSDGPSTEVLILKDTSIYRDVTFDTHEAREGETIKQIIQPLAAEDIQKIDSASVWGSKRGDRLVATFILISRPSMTNRPGIIR